MSLGSLTHLYVLVRDGTGSFKIVRPFAGPLHGARRVHVPDGVQLAGLPGVRRLLSVGVPWAFLGRRPRHAQLAYPVGWACSSRRRRTRGPCGHPTRQRARVLARPGPQLTPAAQRHGAAAAAEQPPEGRERVDRLAPRIEHPPEVWLAAEWAGGWDEPPPHDGQVLRRSRFAHLHHDGERRAGARVLPRRVRRRRARLPLRARCARVCLGFGRFACWLHIRCVCSQSRTRCVRRARRCAHWCTRLRTWCCRCVRVQARA